ncbi:hypothetical protein EU519_00370 [Candidatus Thorarchaeota archaeon]|nr:MAG: hypothetical protein EU519_00370 [Candidatus Thorarchaeota archaeon]
MELATETTTVIQQYQMKFLNDTRTCTCLQDIPEITIGGQKFGPFEQGNRTTLPNWAIDVLSKHGLVDVVPEETFESLRRLQNIYNADKKTPYSLQTLHPMLYAALRQKLNRLQSDKTSLDSRSYETIERIQTMIPLLMETRLSSIIRAAKSGMYKDMKKHMTNEERWLCERLANILSVWRESVSE